MLNRCIGCVEKAVTIKQFPEQPEVYFVCVGSTDPLSERGEHRLYAAATDADAESWAERNITFSRR